MKRVALIFAFIVAGCGSQFGDQRAEINPADFVLLPCGLQKEAPPCALAVIGGKRLLFGAPAGLSSTLTEDNLRQLDGVFLFSLRASDIEGLDEVRNASWRAGRDRALPVSGPQGIGDVVAGLNLAFETADALRIVDEGVPKGGFDAALLVEMERRDETPDIVFDTGDVVIRAMQRADQKTRYSIVYRDAAPFVIETCRVDDCSFGDGLEWPLSAQHFIVNN